MWVSLINRVTDVVVAPELITLLRWNSAEQLFSPRGVSYGYEYYIRLYTLFSVFEYIL